MSQMIFVVSETGADANVSINREIAIVNYLMTAFPDHIFLCRGSFLLTELFFPRKPQVWADFYVMLVERCDALYCHEGYRNHPLADWASDLSLPILDDQMDLELFLGTVDA